MKFRVTLTLVSILLLNTMAFSQDKKYLGKEKDITLSELILKAEASDFGNQIVKMIYSDEKNSYYALKNNSINSKYIKIRILEQSYSDRNLVNIGPEIDDGYMVFLVNNTLKKSEDDIVKLFDSFRLKALKEETSMNEADMNKWLLEHKKFNTK